MRKRTAAWITKIVPADVLLPLIFGFIFNNLVYVGSGLLTANRYHYDMTLPIDDKIPFVSGWIFVYFGCYLFWAANYILIARQGKENAFRFFTADVLSRIVCAVFFILLPTTNIRPVLQGEDLSIRLVRFLYEIDAPTNLFPSIHCLVSWFCFIGIRRRKNIPLWYRGLSCLLAIAVFVSTLTTKQHVIVDVFAGIILAELSWIFANKTNCYKSYMRIFDKITVKVRKFL